VVVLAGLWLVYPVLDLLGPSGAGVWSSTVVTACFTVLDLLAKVAYGFLTTVSSARVAEHDLAAGEVTGAPVTTESVPSGQGVVSPGDSGPR